MALSIPFIDQTDGHIDFFNTCARIFNRPGLPATDLAVYMRAIRANNAQEICDAFKHWISTERHFPAPVEIRQVIQQQKLDATGLMKLRD